MNAAVQLILVFFAGLFFGFAIFDYKEARMYKRFARGSADELLDNAEKRMDEAIRAKLERGDGDGRTSSKK